MGSGKQFLLRFPHRVPNHGFPFLRGDLSGIREIDLMVKPGIGEVVFIAVRSQVFIHERNGGRLIIKGADVHDLHAQTFLNRQKLG